VGVAGKKLSWDTGRVVVRGGGLEGGQNGGQNVGFKKLGGNPKKKTKKLQKGKRVAHKELAHWTTSPMPKWGKCGKPGSGEKGNNVLFQGMKHYLHTPQTGRGRKRRKFMGQRE